MFAFPINHTFTDLFREYEHLSFFPPYHSQNYKLKVLSIKLFINMESHPLRMRGLKLTKVSPTLGNIWSHPLRMRGLKLTKVSPTLGNICVASFADAWIETATSECSFL